MITILLVRHADIDLPVAPGLTDPWLNTAGEARAAQLARIAEAAGVGAVFTSTYTRTKQTAEPTAARLGLQPREVPGPLELAQELWTCPAGAVILIVGHSNTVPEMIGALGVPLPTPTIGETEFDNLFVVALSPGEAGLVHLKYGA